MSKLDTVLKRAGGKGSYCSHSLCPRIGPTKAFNCNNCALSYTNEKSRIQLLKEIAKCLA